METWVVGTKISGLDLGTEFDVGTTTRYDTFKNGCSCKIGHIFERIILIVHKQLHNGSHINEVSKREWNPIISYRITCI